MTPLNSSFSSSNGVLHTDAHVLAAPGLTCSEFDDGVGHHMTARESAPDFVVYGPVSVQLWGRRFVAGIRFFRDVVHGVTLTLEQSKVAALGYDATEKDLLAEKKTLTTMLSKQLECSPTSTYASDGNILLYGGHRVHTKDLPINPGGLRRFSGYGTELSQYVTDGRLVFYKDRMLEGADAASFELIAQPTAKEKSEPELARDISGVYYGADRITDADPVSFRLADFSVTTEGNIHGYYGIDRAHVWNLSNGFQLVMPEYADGIRQRLQKALPLTPEPWKIPRPIKVWGSALLLLIACILIYRLQGRLKSRYQASLLSRAVAVLSGAYLVLPTVGYALLFSRCSKPNDIVVWALLAGGLAGGAWLLSVANLNFMPRADAVATTVVQLGMVAVVLALGTVPAGFIEGLSSIPAGISRQCPREDHDVEARNRIKVASMQNGVRFNVIEKPI